jgi:hypothetical protein
MIGTLSNQIRAAASLGRTFRSRRRDGTCIYYGAGDCNCDVIPHCPHHFAGVCVGAGKCGDCTAHYQAPRELRAWPVGVDLW